MDPTAGALAVGGAVFSVGFTRALMRAVGEPANDVISPTFTQLGIFAVCMVVGYFMLRRSDGRDATSQAAEDKAHKELIESLREIAVKAEERAQRADERAEKADARADEAHDRLLQVFLNERTEQA